MTLKGKVSHCSLSPHKPVSASWPLKRPLASVDSLIPMASIYPTRPVLTCGSLNPSCCHLCALFWCALRKPQEQTLMGVPPAEVEMKPQLSLSSHATAEEKL